MENYFINNLISQLNCISRLATIENAPKTQELTNKIIESIRYKIGRKYHIVRVKKELKAVKDFLDMFKARFGGGIKYHIDVDEDCLNLYIPHFSIMTFVENSIYHAFENKEGEWEVKVIIKKLYTGFRIIISDNGIGFEPNIYIDQLGCQAEYGTLLSTFNRLIEYSKVKNVIAIKSSKDTGTSVTIDIPDLNRETE